MSWDLDGNQVNGNTNFLGTRNNAPLVIRTNTNGAPGNLEEVMRITPSSASARGRVGIATTNPGQQLTLGAGNVMLPDAQQGTDGNLYFGGRTDAGENGLRLFGGDVNSGTIPGGFIDVKTNDPQQGLRIRVDTANGGTERVRIAGNGNVGIGPIAAPNISDMRVKENIRPLRGVLDRLDGVRGVAFDWADTPDVGETRSGKPGMGVIAQEVETAFPELVQEYGDHRLKGVDYNGLVAALLAAAKELRAEVESLRTRITALEAR
jgi:hypothetical protein